MAGGAVLVILGLHLVIHNFGGNLPKLLFASFLFSLTYFWLFKNSNLAYISR